jgi:UDP-3-O-[3-hydroxymyristoyl] glucosamine N-acyltransferase
MKNYFISNPYLLSAFLDDIKRANGEVIELKSEDGFNFDLSQISISEQDDNYLISNGNFSNQGRVTLFAKLTEYGVRLKPLISSNAFYSADMKIGMGSVVYSNALIDGSVSIGFNSIIAPNSIIENEVKIGNHCFIGTNVTLEKGVVIGNNVYIHGNCRIAKDVKIERDVVINDSYMVIRESVKTGMILDSDIGEFVRILR